MIQPMRGRHFCHGGTQLWLGFPAALRGHRREWPRLPGRRDQPDAVRCPCPTLARPISHGRPLHRPQLHHNGKTRAPRRFPSCAPGMSASSNGERSAYAAKLSVPTSRGRKCATPDAQTARCIHFPRRHSDARLCASWLSTCMSRATSTRSAACAGRRGDS